MRKPKIVFLSNALWVKTGLSRNAKAVLKYLYATGKYEIVHYCSMVSDSDMNLNLYPWKSIGALPSNPHEIRQIQQNPNEVRLAAYGVYKIDAVIEQEKPDILILSDDIWGFPIDKYAKASWANKNFLDPQDDSGIHVIHHITIDSLPILPDAIEQCKNSVFLSWASFGAENIKKEKGCEHAKYIHGAVDSTHYAPIPKEAKNALRKTFGIDPNCKVFLYLGRNQLRKKYDSLLKGFALFQKKYPKKKAKLLFHCSWSEAKGWPLERLIQTYGINKEDVLTTYVCKECGRFEIKPYSGEDQPCKFCGSPKSQTTSSLTNGVIDEEMKFVYGFADACISAFTSGGFEYCNAEAMMCGIPLATTEYSCGSDYTKCKNVYRIGHYETTECMSGFIKAEPKIEDISDFMYSICSSNPISLEQISRETHEWAKVRFDAEIIGKQWEDLIDTFGLVDYNKVALKSKEKNPDYPYPNIADDKSFIKDLYRNILLMEISDNDQGLQYWLDQLEKGIHRKNIYNYFIKKAQEENAKNKKIDVRDILVNNGKKTLVLVIKESLGDCILITSLFESIRKSYPKDKYNFHICTDPKFFEVFKGNPYVDRIIPYHPNFEQEAAMIGAGQKSKIVDVLLQPCIGTQRHLNYLSNDKFELELN